MAVNQRTFNGAIVRNVYNARTISQLGSNSQPRCTVASNGTMNSTISTDGFNGKKYVSDDNGYTWSPITGSIHQSLLSNYPVGQSIFITKDNHYLYVDGGGQVNIGELGSSDPDEQFYMVTQDKYGLFQGVCWYDYARFIDTSSLIYCCYSDQADSAKLAMIGINVLDFPYGIVSTQNYILDYANTSDGKAYRPQIAMIDNGADILVASVAYTTTDIVRFMKFTKKIDNGTGSWGSAVSIDTSSTSTGISGVQFHSLGIAKDGNGNIAVVYDRSNDSSTASIPYVSTSTDSGAIFSAPVQLSFPTNYSGNIDSVTGLPDNKLDVLGNADGGFLISAVFQSGGIPQVFTIQLSSLTNFPSSSGTTYTSWTEFSTGTSENLNGLVYGGGGEFLAVGNAGTIKSFKNGTWTSKTSGTTKNLTAVIKASGTYVAVGDSGTIIKSSDGDTWTACTAATPYNLKAVHEFSGYYLACGTDVVLKTSGLAYTWNNLDIGISGYQWNGFANNGSTLVAFAGAFGGLIRATTLASNLNTWTARTANTTQGFQAGAYHSASGWFIGVGDTGTVDLSLSPNASGWKVMPSGTTSTLYDVTLSGNTVYAVGATGKFSERTNPSGTWSFSTVDASKTLKAVEIDGSAVVVVGNAGYAAVSGTLIVGGSVSTAGGFSNWARSNSNTFTLPDRILGAQIVKYEDRKLPKFNDFSNLFIIYNAGLTNSNLGGDSVENYVYLEPVANATAVPSVSGGGSSNFPTSSYSGTAFTKDMIDFYASGYVDKNTDLYINKINDLGFDVSFTRWDPIQSSEINNSLGYNMISTTTQRCLIDPGSFGYGSVARNDNDFSDYMERDSRKLFYKPSLYLERLFVLTKGGYLKKTIWTLRLYGNDYEIAQIVPRFLGNNILYYEANLYVIGPNNDVFTKISLPSET